jgi:DNA-binding winged helix-turn-helix (wHTH) protein
VLDPNERILLADGEPVHLTDKVFDTLYLLVRNNGRLLTKEQMMASIWEESFVEEGNLAKNISRLRKILNEDDATVIETVPRRGYRFAADIKELDSDTSLLIRRNLRVKITQTSDQELIETAPEDARKRQLESSIASHRSYVPFAAVATVLLGLAAALGFYFLKNDASQPQLEAGVIQINRRS